MLIIIIVISLNVMVLNFVEELKVKFAKVSLGTYIIVRLTRFHVSKVHFRKIWAYFERAWTLGAKLTVSHFTFI